ncbi:arylsulfotransferase family protein [Alloalcanivorax sp. C16-2]|uniref:arylsulfotransferase family protein n=1 Tax=Alloalcanivorax sp. C16-2 TaxID=3390052 RepID=UPI0039705BCB
MKNSDRIGFGLFFLAIVFIAFVGGAFVVLTKTYPYPLFNDAHKAAQAVLKQNTLIDLYTQSDLWREARRDERGVTIHDPERAYQGLTLYTSGDGSHADLVDMEGKVLHRWALPYSKVWEQSPPGRAARPDDHIYWRKARVLPNGDLLAIYIANNDTPWGYGLVRLNADSEVIWGYHASTHHDLDITPDGDVVVLTHEFTDRKVPAFAKLEYPWLDDYLVVLDGDTGEERSKVSLSKAFMESRYADLFYAVPSFATADPLHTNSVQFLNQDLADRFAPADGRAGQVLLSFRHPGAVALVDADSGEMTWALKGPWLGQHYPRINDAGHFTLFDNLGHFEKDNRTRVLEVDPENDRIVASYTGDAEHPFDSGLRGAVEELPNGDWLITESDGGRLFEVAPDGDIVWEFVNPVRAGDQDQYIPVVSAAQRLTLDDLDADFRARLVPRSDP